MAENIHLYLDYRFMLPFYKHGYLSFQDGTPTLNIHKMKGKKWGDIIYRAAADQKLGPRNIDALYECLERNGVGDLPDREVFSGVNEHKQDRKSHYIRETIVLPDSLVHLLDGETGTETYGGGKEAQDWFNQIILPDGTKTNALEIKIAQRMSELGVRRTHRGLMFEKGEFAGESATLSKILGKSSSKGGMPKRPNSLEIYASYVPNLRKAGLIQEGDFFVNERGDVTNIRLKRKTSSDVSLHSSFGTSKYYFGNARYIHNHEPIPEQTFTAALDNRIGGVFEEHNGIKKLKYTFPLITADESEKEKERIAARFNKKIGELTESEITQNRRKRLVPEEVREYSTTDYISPYRDEPAKEYAKRVEAMSNGEATVNAINEIFMGANIGHSPLSWGKKLRLAEAVKRIDKEKIITFAKKFGVSGLQVLLASEVEKGWPEEVLSYSDKLGMNDLFETYAPLLTDEDEFKGVIDTSTFKNEAAREHLADLRRASLEDVISGIRNIAQGKAQMADAATKSREGVLAKLSLVKALKKEGLLDSLEDIKGVQFGVQNPQDIPREDRRVMRAMYAENYTDNPRVQDELLKKFDSSIADTSGKDRFFVFRHNGAVKGFYRLKETAPGQYYFASFNIDPTYKGYKLGETMLEESLDSIAKDSILAADCDSKLPISAKYIETGWVAVRYWDDYGDKVLDIVRNDKERNRYIGKQLRKEDIVAGRVLKELLVKTAGEQKDLPFGLCNEGYVLTRMFFDRGTKKHYAVFESALPARIETETNADASHK